MAAIDSFDDVRGLTEPELRALLERGTAEERLWALWALALRSTSNVDALAQRASPQAGPTLRSSPLSEPSPGVRRNFAVVLAGHGHYDLLVALAKRDPAPLVRAAAMQLIARIALDGKLPTAIVRERVASDVGEVKVAVLGTIFDGAPAWLVELAEQLLEDREGDVRYEAFEALVRCGHDARARMWLEEAPEAETRMALARWTANGAVRPAADVLVSASRRLRRLLIESVRVATWHDLAPVVAAEPTLLRAVASRVPHVLDEIPLVILVRVTLREPNDVWIASVGTRLSALPSADSDLAPWLPDLVELVSRRIAEIDQAMHEMSAQPDQDLYTDIDLHELADLRTMHENARDAALQFLVH
jgi:hypothetical protein